MSRRVWGIFVLFKGFAFISASPAAEAESATKFLFWHRGVLTRSAKTAIIFRQVFYKVCAEKPNIFCGEVA